MKASNNRAKHGLIITTRNYYIVEPFYKRLKQTILKAFEEGRRPINSHASGIEWR